MCLNIFVCSDPIPCSALLITTFINRKILGSKHLRPLVVGYDTAGLVTIQLLNCDSHPNSLLSSLSQEIASRQVESMKEL